MLNKLLSCIRRYGMLEPGDTVICAVSGGKDSMALLWAMHLLAEKLDIRVQAAHFNHGLRGAESDRDEEFVRTFCASHEIECHVGRAQVTAGKKGLEAAAREARYAFFSTLPGKIATAHTANDNAETVLLHLVRGTGLRGLGAIAPVRGRVIRPMLQVTRQEIVEFLEEYNIPSVSDSSNETDDFLRNRLRHHVMPLLLAENPQLAQNLSVMAQELREDEAALSALAGEDTPTVSRLREMPSAIRRRCLSAMLERFGVKEPERAHILLLESLVFSEKPSAAASFPGGVTVRREYEKLVCGGDEEAIAPALLDTDGSTEAYGFRVICTPGKQGIVPCGALYLRSRRAGDEMRVACGTKTLKKLFIEKKIPAGQRPRIPVIADEKGVVYADGIGYNVDRLAENGIRFRIEKT